MAPSVKPAEPGVILALLAELDRYVTSRTCHPVSKGPCAGETVRLVALPRPTAGLTDYRCGVRPILRSVSNIPRLMIPSSSRLHVGGSGVPPGSRLAVTMTGPDSSVIPPLSTPYVSLVNVSVPTCSAVGVQKSPLPFAVAVPWTGAVGYPVGYPPCGTRPAELDSVQEEVPI